MTETKEETKVSKTSKSANRPYVLTYLERNSDGLRTFVELPFPPGFSTEGTFSKAKLWRKIKKAVDDGNEMYYGRDLYLFQQADDLKKIVQVPKWEMQ